MITDTKVKPHSNYVTSRIGISKSRSLSVPSRLSQESMSSCVNLYHVDNRTLYSPIFTVSSQLVNAGITEASVFPKVSLGPDGSPLKPNLATIDVNLVGALYSKKKSCWMVDCAKQFVYSDLPCDTLPTEEHTS